MNFSDVTAASKDEQIRAYSIEQAIESAKYVPPQRMNEDKLIKRAAQIEDYIKNGKKEGES